MILLDWSCTLTSKKCLSSFSAYLDRKQKFVINFQIFNAFLALSLLPAMSSFCNFTFFSISLLSFIAAYFLHRFFIYKRPISVPREIVFLGYKGYSQNVYLGKRLP